MKLRKYVIILRLLYIILAYLCNFVVFLMHLVKKSCLVARKGIKC